MRLLCLHQKIYLQEKVSSVNSASVCTEKLLNILGVRQFHAGTSFPLLWALSAFFIAGNNNKMLLWFHYKPYVVRKL